MRTEEARLIDAVKRGQELEALITALHGVQDQRRALEQDLTALDAAPVPGPADSERLRAALTSRAGDVRDVLVRREPEARRVLQALLTDRLKFAPFNEGPTRKGRRAGISSSERAPIEDSYSATPVPPAMVAPTGYARKTVNLLVLSFETLALAA